MTDIAGLTDLFESSGFLDEQAEKMRELSKKINENEVVISVIGQFKRGKSSLINAILGEEILPSAIIPLTTVITEIRYSDIFRAEVCFKNGRKKEIKTEELYDYCSEQKNRGNEKGVKLVRIYTPDQPFGKGTVLVDTPGVGSVHQHNTDSSYEYLGQSDAIIFLLSVDSPVSETERDFLMSARQNAVKFFFAVNKIDNISKKDLDTFTAFCRNVIMESIGTDVNIIPVSALTGEGIDRLKEEIGDVLKNSHNMLLTESVYKKFEMILGQATAKTDIAIKANSIPACQLEEKLERIEEKQNELSDFGEEISVLARHRTHLLVDRISEIFDKETETVKRDTEEECTRIFNDNKDLSTSRFEEVFSSDTDRYIRKRLAVLNDLGLEMLEEGYVKISDVLSRKTDEASDLIAELMEEEFGLEYPMEKNTFHVSEKSDFIYHISERTVFMFDMTKLDRLLPKKTANRRFYERGMKRAVDDIERNKNNMLYNYRYKMQESLRTLCDQMILSVNNMTDETEALFDHIKKGFNDIDRTRMDQERKLEEIKRRIEEIKASGKLSF